MNKKNQKSLKIGFVGCGKMASAIVKGLINSKFLPAQQIFASEINEEFAKQKAKDMGIEVFTDNKILVETSDVVIIATKPNLVRKVVEEINSSLTKDKLLVSIAAGVKLSVIEEIVKNIPVIRVMPNAPLLVSEGMCGIVKGTNATDKNVEFIYDLFSKMGKCIILPEDKIDILTAISGSGPAFFYKTIHEMALAGEKLGLEYKKSLLLAAQTAIGSAKIMLNGDVAPETLIDNISTKGGCTEVGVSVMNDANTQNLFFEVIKQTTQKAIDLGK